MERKRSFLKKKDNVWQLEEAKKHFSYLVNEAIKDGYQTIKKNGKIVAMLVSIEEFEKMRASKTSLVDFFREAPLPEIDLDIKKSEDLGRDDTF